MPVSAWSGAGIDVGHHPAALRPIPVVASALTAALLAVTAAPAQAATAAQRPAASGGRTAPYSASFSVVLNGRDVTLPSTSGYYVTDLRRRSW
jgi:hypothetical protein